MTLYKALKNSPLLQVPLHVWRHPANRNARLRAVLNAALFQLRGRLLHQPSYAKVGARGRVLCPPHSNGSSAMVYANPPDFDEMSFWRTFLNVGDLFVDVGSNVGSYAIWAGDCGAEVWAFEPDPLAFSRLQTNLALNHFQILAHQMALGDEPGQMQLTLGLDTTNRLIVDQSRLNSGGTQTVPMSTIDLIVAERAVRGLKIDVEGAERLVIEGAKNALTVNRIDVLQIEWNTMSDLTLNESRGPLLKLMLEYGYRPFRPKGGRMVPVPESEAASYGPDLFFVAPTVVATLP